MGVNHYDVHVHVPVFRNISFYVIFFWWLIFHKTVCSDLELSVPFNTGNVYSIYAYVPYSIHFIVSHIYMYKACH